MSSRPIATRRGRSGGSASKMVGASFRIARGGHEPAGLVEEKEARALALGEPLPVDPHVVRLADVVGGAVEHFAVDGDPAGGDPGFRVAARAEARPRHHLGDALAFPDFRGRRRLVAHALSSAPDRGRFRIAGKRLS